VPDIDADIHESKAEAQDVNCDLPVDTDIDARGYAWCI
jgi:hypothetical protein